MHMRTETTQVYVAT